MIIYADILVALNVLIDYLLLCCCGAVRRLPLRRGRLLCAGLLGGVASLQIFLPIPDVLSGMIAVIVGALLCLVAFGFRDMRQFIRNILCFIGMGFAYSACMYGLWFFLHPSGMYWHGGYVYFDISPMQFVLLTLLTYGILTVVQRLMRFRDRQEGRIVRLQLTHNGKNVCGRGLVDSGNLLREPVSGCPVIVADENLLAEIQPKIQHPESLTDTEAVQSGFRMVRFHTMNGGGCMAACRIGRIASPDAALRPAAELYAAACPGLKARTGWDFILPAAALAEHIERGNKHEQ